MADTKDFVVSALKFRPQKFSEVSGQEHIADTLRNAVRRERLAHAYLFCGPRGVGKTSTARILAKAMNCVNLVEGEPCNQCESCQTITQGRCMDVIELDAASNRGIDEVRDLRENVRFAPSSCRYKVYIIDEAHQLTKEAFNALLKTLEEPPPHAKFILATTEAEKMIDTIISRCQQFRFKPLSLQKIVENLRGVVAAQGTSSIPESILNECLFLIARASDGGMRDALSLFDQVSSLADESLTLEEVELVLGGVRLSTLFDLTDSIRKRDITRALELVHTSYNQGQDMALLVRDLLGHFRNLMVCKTAPGHSDLVGLPTDQTQFVSEQAQRLSLEDLLQGLDVLFEAERRLKLTASPRAVCESAVVKLAMMPTTVEIEALLGRNDIPLRSLGAARTGGTAPPASSPPQPQPSESAKETVTQSAPKDATPKSGSTEKPPETETLTPVKEDPPHPPAGAGPKTKSQEKNARVGIHMEDTPDQDLIETLVDRWEGICHKVGERSISVGGHLTDAIPHSFDGNVLNLLIHEDLSFHFKQLSTPSAREALKAVLLDEIGIGPEIKVTTATSEELARVRPPVLDHEVPPARELPSMEEIVQAEPVVQNLLDAFDGVVVEIRNNPNR